MCREEGRSDLEFRITFASTRKEEEEEVEEEEGALVLGD